MKAVIIEDEHLIAQELVSKIRSIADDIDIVQILPSLKTAKKWFMQNAEPDMIFMDIQLSDGISFELFDHYKITCPVVFTTAYDEYALRAFKVNGVDYLLKPIDDESLARSIDKCRKLCQHQQPYPVNIKELISSIGDQKPSLYKQKFIVNQRNNWIPVNTSDIACFMRENLNYIFTFAGDKYILDFTTLEEIEEILDPRVFYRANRQSIINIDAIQSVTPHENQKLSVALKAPLKFTVDISREKAPVFKKWFDR